MWIICNTLIVTYNHKQKNWYEHRPLCFSRRPVLIFLNNPWRFPHSWFTGIWIQAFPGTPGKWTWRAKAIIFPLYRDSEWLTHSFLVVYHLIFPFTEWCLRLGYYWYHPVSLIITRPHLYICFLCPFPLYCFLSMVLNSFFSSDWLLLFID